MMLMSPAAAVHAAAMDVAPVQQEAADLATAAPARLAKCQVASASVFLPMVGFTQSI